MYPIISIVGRTGVGKTHIFNLLLNKQVKNIKEILPTRDRIYENGVIDGTKCVVVDTGGINFDSVDKLDKLVIAQAKVALEGSDIILFVVDATVGLTFLDKKIKNLILKFNRPILLLINKVDQYNLDNIYQFKSLGISDLCEIGISNGNNAQLLCGFLAPFLISAKKNVEELGTVQTKDAINITILGRPNVGKSTLTNSLIGETRVIISDIPGTTLDSIMIPYTEGRRRFVLIDTAGIRRKVKIKENIETRMVYKSLRSIDLAHVVLYLIDAKEGVVDQDLKLINYITEGGKPLILIVNKWDLLSLLEKIRQKRIIVDKLKHVDFIHIEYISALKSTNLKYLLKVVLKIFNLSTKRFATPLLSKILQKAVEQHSPPLCKGRFIKLQYAHMGGVGPHLIIIHGNRTKFLPKSYIRYLQSYFYKALSLESIQLKLIFKDKN